MIDMIVKLAYDAVPCKPDYNWCSLFPGTECYKNRCACSPGTYREDDKCGKVYIRVSM